MNDTTELARYQTTTALLDTWTLAQAELEQGFGLIRAAYDRLNAAFEGGHLYLRFPERMDFSDDECPELIEQWELRLWDALIGRSGMKDCMSLKQIAELDKQLQNPKEMPPLTLANIQQVVWNARENMGTMLQEKVKEVYDWLRPGGWRLEKYKTNEKCAEAGLGKKVILTYGVRANYGGGFEPDYGMRDHFKALDQTFALLDGKPTSGFSYQGPLADAMGKVRRGEVGETDYFRFRIFANRNMHLEFIREDLLDKLNLVAAGMILKRGEAQAA